MKRISLIAALVFGVAALPSLVFGASTNVLAGVTVGVSQGGTGATTAPGALTNLGAAPIASPSFSGTPTSTTPSPGDNTTKIATTAFVGTALTNFLVGPTFSGSVSAPTPSPGDNTTKIATTAFVGTALSNGFTNPAFSGNQTLTSSSTTSTQLDLNNTAASGKNWRLFSSGGGYSGVGTFGLYDVAAGATRFFVDTAGKLTSNVGITVSNNTPGLTYLDTSNTDTTSGGSGVDIRLVTRNAANTSIAVVDMVKYANGTFSITNNEPGSTGSIYLQTLASKITLDNSGKVSIGNVTPSAPVHAYANVSGGGPASSGSSQDPNNVLRVQAGDSTSDFGAYVSGAQWIQSRSVSNYATNRDLHINPNGGAIRTGSGGLYVNGASSGNIFGASGDSTASAPMAFLDVRSGTTASPLLSIIRNGTLVGSISTTNAATAFNTTSDGRLKSDVRALGNPGDVLDKVKPVVYNWKYQEGRPKGIGFIAQDLYEACPECVTKGDSDTEDPTSDKFKQWSVDFSKLVPYLVAEVKNLRKRTDLLEESNLQLKSDNEALRAKISDKRNRKSK